jgi:pyrimidine-nucleoside phosphorylase
LGIALAILGGGRARKEDHIDAGVGLEFHRRIGDRVECGQPLVTIHYNADTKLDEAHTIITESYEIGADPPTELPPLIRRVIQPGS